MESSKSDLFRNIAAFVGLIIAAVLVFGFFKLRRDDRLASQANSVAQTFIKSSPLVQDHLGRIEKINETGEQHGENNEPGWFLNYNVTGNKGNGVVRMHMRWNDGKWAMPSAQLTMGDGKPVDLR